MEFFQVDGEYLCAECLTPSDIMEHSDYMAAVLPGEETPYPVDCGRCSATCDYVTILEAL